MKARSIKQLIEIALSDSVNNHAELVIGRLPIGQAKHIMRYVKENLVGSERIIDTSGIRHAIKEHGSPTKEAKRGQIAITLDDIYKVPLVLKEPDAIVYAGKNSLKQDVFLFSKKIGSVYVVAECVRFAKRGNKLVFATMYKKP